MKKILISLLIIAVLFFSGIGIAQAGSSDSVSITVTIRYLDITVGVTAGGDIHDFGIMNLDSISATTGGAFTVTNNCNADVNLGIQGNNSADWDINTVNTSNNFILKCQGGDLTGLLAFTMVLF